MSIQKQSLEERENQLMQEQVRIEQQLIQLNQLHAQTVGRRLELRKLIDETKGNGEQGNEAAVLASQEVQ